jgi:hypothetical protein
VRKTGTGWVLVSYGTNDNTVIQAGMDALTLGGLFHLVNDTYLINTAALTPNYSGIVLEGENDQTTTLRKTVGTHNIIERNVAAPVIYVFTVRNMFIDGSGLAGDGIHISNVGTRDVTLESVAVVNCYDGFSVDSGNSNLTHCFSEHNSHYGYYTPSGTTLMYCYAYDNDDAGFALGNLNLVVACVSIFNGAAGFHFLSTYSILTACRTEHNWTLAPGNSREIEVHNNNNTLIGNLIDGGNTTSYGIDVYQYDNIIAFNKIVNVTIAGLYLETNALRTVCFMNVGGTIVDTGTDTKLATLVLPFVSGTTFLSADGAAWGWEIDAAGEYAIALGTASSQLVALNTTGLSRQAIAGR